MMLDFMVGGTYLILGIVAAAAFLVFAAGRFVGGILDDGAPPPTDAPLTRRFGRWINTAGDNGQRAAGTILILTSLIMLGMSGLRWYTLGKDGMIFVLSAVTASIMFFYLSASEEQKKARGIQTNWLLTAAWVGFILINAFVSNNAEWFPVRIKEIAVAERKELVIPTPTGSILSVPEILGPAWQNYLTAEKDSIEPGLALNLATGGFDLRWNKEEKRYEMRSTRILPRWGFARGEYSQVEDIRLTQNATNLDVKETDIVQKKREARLEAGKIPLTSRLPIKGIALAIAIILVGLGLLAYVHEEKKPTDPKPATPKAA